MAERVAFLVEETGERFSALLNPDTVHVRRHSGVRTLADRPGTIAGHGGTDDALIATGGGRTEIELDLLFDVALAPVNPQQPTVDVRDLTGTFWSLSENRPTGSGLPAVRMIWGERWNVCAVVEAVAERFERFAADGAPTRSFLSMRLIRTAEPGIRAVPATWIPSVAPSQITPRAPFADVPGALVHEVLDGEFGDGERLDLLAARYYADPRYWRHLAAANNITTNLPWVPPGTLLIVPPIDLLAAPPDDPGPDEPSPGDGVEPPPGEMAIASAVSATVGASAAVADGTTTTSEETP